jgi:hypothetical protein
MDDRRPPKTGWAKLVPELLVSDIGASLEFWCNRLGFAIAYQRPKEAFAYLERPEGAQIMLSQRSGKWQTAPLDRPYGRGTIFQVYVTGAGHAVTAGHILRSKGLVMAQSETTARIAANPAGRPFFFALAGPRRALVDGLDGCLLIRRCARARARA